MLLTPNNDHKLQNRESPGPYSWNGITYLVIELSFLTGRGLWLLRVELCVTVRLLTSIGKEIERKRRGERLGKWWGMVLGVNLLQRPVPNVNQCI